MTMMSGGRWTALGLLLVAVAALWQAHSLPRWSFDGPGTGIFPLVLSIIAITLSVLVLITERREAEPLDSDDTEAVSRYDLAAPAEKRVFHFYLLGLVLLVAGSWWAGFIATAFAVIIVIMRFGEGVRWRATLITAAVVALVGQLGFGWLLQVSLPEGPADRALKALLRAGGLL
jgi:hypothetical protein